MESDNLGLNIVFMPPKEVSDLAISQCSHIAQHNEISFKLDGTGNFPHVTIYQLVIPEKNLEKLTTTLRGIANNTGPKLFEFTKYEAHGGFIGACFLPAEPIKNIQKKIVRSVTLLREGRNVIEADSEKAKSFPDLQRGIIREYGFDNLFEFYNPHITVTRMVDPKKAEEVLKTLKWPFGEFKTTSIGLYTLGEFGTCNKLIKEFKLGAEN